MNMHCRFYYETLDVADKEDLMQNCPGNSAELHDDL